jgi:geranylgeranyl diphosphate synthase type I
VLPQNADAFDTLRRRVDARLASVLDATEKLSDKQAHDALPILTQVHELTMRGGKRLRPALVLAAVECIAPSDTIFEAVTDVACAIELLQTYLLIHDDWMDGDEVRRGGPTVHVALAQTFGGTHLGACAAILSGDMAIALAQEFLSSPHIPPARLQTIVRRFAAMQREVVLGQTLDLIDSSDVDAKHDLKTGSYTVRGPLALGHAVAGGDTAQWASLDGFARPLGIAFQLRDDLIGSFGDERETGKSAGTDLRAGKHTAPVAIALKNLGTEGRRELESLLGDESDESIARARELIEHSGAIEAVEQRISDLRTQALHSLDVPQLRVEGRTLLGRLARIMTDRRK